MYKIKKEKYIMKHPEEKEIETVLASSTPSKFIISRKSYLNMLKNDSAFVIFVVYSIYLPLIISYSTII